MKVSEQYRGPLVKEIMTGTIQRERYPELWGPVKMIRVTTDGPIETMTPQDPAVIPQADRRRLAGQIMKGEVNPEEFPSLWPPHGTGGVRVILPDPTEDI